MIKILRLCALVLTFLPSFSFSSELFREEDIRKTVDKLIEYHIDIQDISSDILIRSLIGYSQSFDPHKAYLTEQEVSNFIQSTDIKKRLLRNYKTNNFSVYQNLNHVVKDSITRARQWRSEWLSDPVALVREASTHTLIKKPGQWAHSIQELKERQRSLLLSYISVYLSDGSKDRYLGKEASLTRLCVRQLEAYENPYLGINDYGKPMSLEEESHHFHVRVVKAMVHSLDAHTTYFSKDEALAMRIQLEKGMCGIGVILKEDIDGVIIKEIIPGGPADKTSELHVDDVIYRVDGKSIENLPFKAVLDCLRGSQGSEVVLDVHSKDQNRTVKLRREKISLDDRRVDVSYEPYGDGIIGKITLHSFYEGENQVSSEQDLKRAIQSLQDKNLLGLVLDIRENTGGFLSQAIKVSGLFMTNGVVVVSRYADGSIKRYRTISPKKFYDGPLTILVSKSSASAAEIVAQTLQDYGVAIIVGDEQTYGKGTIQHQTITADSDKEGFFKVTVGKYYSPSGKSTQLHGVRSDIHIASRYLEEPLGERYLEHPLPSDNCDNVMDDNLGDLDSHMRPWFQKYYLPNLQKEETVWREMLPQLSANSQQRLNENKNYKIFLDELKGSSDEMRSFGSNDLQMEESVNILKDMILLRDRKASVSLGG
ncbi:cell division related penicillin-binding proteinase [Chlamydia felis Fe/C-56]|uniref:Cell division related penicillin-binding proteinase n=1 Tax=Chlamydia felis (strain Fe/C-56) TaxID=264202 RepID=Q253E7_CHLFF|nr:S41 family peptidase [Chlamydia felis]BAE81591.1 cell division related penicillin-binding proteinase [Chlamydia felis Fe/C-56]